MNAVLLIARREFFAYLRSPLGSAIIAACLLIDGILFYSRTDAEAAQRRGAAGVHLLRQRHHDRGLGAVDAAARRRAPDRDPGASQHRARQRLANRARRVLCRH